MRDELETRAQGVGTGLSPRRSMVMLARGTRLPDLMPSSHANGLDNGRAAAQDIDHGWSLDGGNPNMFP